jgi:hypothetical protein
VLKFKSVESLGRWSSELGCHHQQQHTYRACRRIEMLHLFLACVMARIELVPSSYLLHSHPNVRRRRNDHDGSVRRRFLDSRPYGEDGCRISLRMTVQVHA